MVNCSMHTKYLFARDSVMTICSVCETNELSKEDEAVNKFAVRTLKVPCFSCREEIIRKYAKHEGKTLTFPDFSHEEYLAVPYYFRRQSFLF